MLYLTNSFDIFFLFLYIFIFYVRAHKKKYSMREIFISCITAFVILTSIYFQKINKEESTKSILLQNSSLKSKFNSGITIQDAGEVIVIEQKPNDATVIIDKNDLDDIIVFLNTKSESE